jgi:5-methylcytosine-specific restriction endonuclease McrA
MSTTKDDEIEAAWIWYESNLRGRSEKNAKNRGILADSQNWKCYFCGCTMTEYNGHTRQDSDCSLEHLTPTSRGGTDDIENLAAACRSCNNEKGQMLESEYREFLALKNSIRE